MVTPKNGTPVALDEPYIYNNDTSNTRYFCDAVGGQASPSATTCPPGALGVLVPTGRLWVMGDHRGNSSDSRFHMSDVNRGTVPESKVVGRAFSVVYPFGHAKFLHVPSAFTPLALPAAPYAVGLLGALPITYVRRRRRAGAS